VVEDPKTGPYVKGAIDKVGPGLASRPHRAHPARTARLHARPSRLQLAAVRSVTRDSEFSDRNLAQCAFASVQVVRDADEALAVLADGESQRHFAATNMCATSAPGRGLRPHLGPCFVLHKGLPRNTARLSLAGRAAAPRRAAMVGLAAHGACWHGIACRAPVSRRVPRWLHCGRTVVVLCLYLARAAQEQSFVALSCRPRAGAGDAQKSPACQDGRESDCDKSGIDDVHGMIAQHVVLCRTSLPCVTTCCAVLHHVATCCTVSHLVALCHNVVNAAEARAALMLFVHGMVVHASATCLQHRTTCCNVVQHAATQCDVLQHHATWQNMRQRGATCCNIVQLHRPSTQRAPKYARQDARRTGANVLHAAGRTA
jgi:hypothetical protein